MSGPTVRRWRGGEVEIDFEERSAVVIFIVPCDTPVQADCSECNLYFQALSVGGTGEAGMMLPGMSDVLGAGTLAAGTRVVEGVPPNPR